MLPSHSLEELLALNDPQPKPDVPSSVDPSVVASTPEVSPTMGTFVDSLDKRIRGPLLDSCMDALKKLHGSGATFMETLGQSFQDAVRFELKSFWVALLDEMTV